MLVKKASHLISDISDRNMEAVWCHLQKQKANVVTEISRSVQEKHQPERTGGALLKRKFLGQLFKYVEIFNLTTLHAPSTFAQYLYVCTLTGHFIRNASWNMVNIVKDWKKKKIT